PDASQRNCGCPGTSCRRTWIPRANWSISRAGSSTPTPRGLPTDCGCPDQASRSTRAPRIARSACAPSHCMKLLPTVLNSHPLGARDIHWLTAAFLCAAAPHLLRMPLWTSALVAGIAAIRIMQVRLHFALPRKWLLALIAVAAAGGILLQYRTLFGRDAGVSMLVIMLALKLLETNTRR